eukprot:jgi/Ulvmu1/10134/UM006_0088.1
MLQASVAGCPRGRAASCRTRTSWRPLRISMPETRVVKCKSAASTEGELITAEAAEMDLRSLPTVRGLPVLGMAKYLFDNNLDLREMHEEHGPVFAINLGIFMGGWSLAVSDVDAVRDVVTSDHTRFVSRWPDQFVRLFAIAGRQPTPEELEPWKRSILRILSLENVSALQLPMMVRDMTARLRKLTRSGEQVLWQVEARRVAFGVASRATMGSLVTDADLDRLFVLFNKVRIDGDPNFGLKDGLPGTPYWNAVQARKQIEAILLPKIRAALANPSALDDETSALTRMLAALQDDLHRYEDEFEDVAEYIAANAYFLMLTGTDTSGTVLLRMVIVMHRHPDWFQKLQEEQDRLRQEFGDTLDRKVLSRSAVAMAIAHEVLRLNIPVRSIFRSATCDTTVAGVRVPRGTRVVINLQMATEATGSPEFNPAQWLNDDMTRARANDSPGNLVWGGGPRRCAGQSLVMVELTTCLAVLGREVSSFEIPPETNDHDYCGLKPHPTGCPCTMIART